jgi:hypothetical protein
LTMCTPSLEGALRTRTSQQSWLWLCGRIIVDGRGYPGQKFHQVAQGFLRQLADLNGSEALVGR